MYTGPEFQLGQVYDGGSDSNPESVLLYRPVYVCIPNPKLLNTPSARARLMVDPQQQQQQQQQQEGSSSGGKKNSKRTSTTPQDSADKTSTM